MGPRAAVEGTQTSFRETVAWSVGMFRVLRDVYEYDYQGREWQDGAPHHSYESTSNPGVFRGTTKHDIPFA